MNKEQKNRIDRIAKSIGQGALSIRQALIEHEERFDSIVARLDALEAVQVKPVCFSCYDDCAMCNHDVVCDTYFCDNCGYVDKCKNM